MPRLKLLGANIKKYRELQALSQNKLGEMVELSREYLADVERGHKRISLKKLFVIADALDVDCSNLVDFK